MNTDTSRSQLADSCSREQRDDKHSCSREQRDDKPFCHSPSGCGVLIPLAFRPGRLTGGVYDVLFHIPHAGQYGTLNLTSRSGTSSDREAAARAHSNWDKPGYRCRSDAKPATYMYCHRCGV